jgi:hypothetical protein
MEINHHLGDTFFCRLHPGLVCDEPKLPANGGLHARAVEDLAFDFRSRDRFRAHCVNRDLFPVGL